MKKLQFLKNGKAWMLGFIFALLVVPALSVSAQTATLAVNLDINGAVNSMFTSTNTFMPVFAPIIGIGIGASIAIALLTFLGATLLKAFRNQG